MEEALVKVVAAVTRVEEALVKVVAAVGRL